MAPMHLAKAFLVAIWLLSCLMRAPRPSQRDTCKGTWDSVTASGAASWLVPPRVLTKTLREAQARGGT